MKDIYTKLKEIRNSKNLIQLDEIIKEIEKSQYIVVDIPFNNVDMFNVCQNEEGEIKISDFSNALELLQGCQQGKLLKI